MQNEIVREISKLKKKSLDGGKLWYLDSGFAILQDSRVVYKMQQAEKCWRGWHEVNSFIPPLNYHRSTWKDGNFLGELPSFHGSFLLFLCPWFRNTRHAFSTAISPCLYKGAFVSTCMIMLSPMQTLFAPVSPVRASPTRGGSDIVDMWQTFERNATNRGNNFACFDAIVSKRKEKLT